LTHRDHPKEDVLVADTVHCGTHGERERAYVCTHLVGDSVALGFNSDETTEENPHPDGWCDDCEIIRVEHGGWNEESENLIELALLCSGCYELSRIRNTRPSPTLDDLANLRWQCGSCEEWHTGAALDFGYDAPAYWRKDLEKSVRWSYLPSGKLHKPAGSFLDDDYCAVDDESFFVRGLIELPIIGSAETFGWGVWGSLSRVNFEALLKADQNGETAKTQPMFSWLSNNIADYPDTLNLKMYAEIQEAKMRPHFRVELSDHPLAQEFHHGITPARVREIMLRRLPSARE
jgi:hypothetical protein